MGKVHYTIENYLKGSFECMSAMLAELSTDGVTGVGDQSFVDRKKIDLERTEKLKNLSEALLAVHSIIENLQAD